MSEKLSRLRFLRLFVGVGCQIAEIGREGADDRLADKDGLDATVEKDRYLTIIEHMDFQVRLVVRWRFRKRGVQKHGLRFFKLILQGLLVRGMQSIATKSSLSIRW